MALETELKLRVGGHDAVRDALKRAGATFIRRQLEQNTFLDTARDDLLQSGSGLRVRAAKDLASGQVDVIITHKGPRRPGPMKIREETELRVASHGDAVRLLGQLGYQVKLSFEKRRETWRLGNCEVVLDELPGAMGLFVEIEGEAGDIERVQEMLSLGDAPTEPRGYAELIAEHLAPSGGRRLAFAD